MDVYVKCENKDIRCIIFRKTLFFSFFNLTLSYKQKRRKMKEEFPQHSQNNLSWLLLYQSHLIFFAQVSTDANRIWLSKVKWIKVAFIIPQVITTWNIEKIGFDQHYQNVLSINNSYQSYSFLKKKRNTKVEEWVSTALTI